MEYSKIISKLQEVNRYYNDAQWLIERQGFHSEVNVLAIKHTLMNILILLKPNNPKLPNFDIERRLFTKWLDRATKKVYKCERFSETPNAKVCFITVIDRLLCAMRAIGFIESEFEQLYNSKKL